MSDGTIHSLVPAELDGHEESKTRARQLIVAVVTVCAVVIVTYPFSAADMGDQPSFLPAMLGVVGALDLISAVLLVHHFTDTGDRRALVLASSYVFLLVVLAGYTAAFPGLLADVGPLGAWASTAPWLWVAWHAAFPVLLAAAVAPWPARWDVPMSVRRRRSAVSWTVASALLAGCLVVLVAVTGRGWLPVLIDGLDLSALTRVVGPVIFPLVTAAVVVAIVGALRLSGPVRWAALAATAALGDVVLTLLSFHRYSLGWYVGRGLTVVSCAVVLVAMLAEFSRLKSQLAKEKDRLQALLTRTEELEALHSTLLDHMPDGVMLHAEDGRLIATNPAAQSLMGLGADQLDGTATVPWQGTVLRPDGSTWPHGDTPVMVTLRTGEAQRDRMVGVQLPDGPRRWLRVNTSATRAGANGHGFVVSSMTDETERYDAHLTATHDRNEKRRRVQSVLCSVGPQIVVQPIVDMLSGRVHGGEALSRFPTPPSQGPDRWFADAVEVGLGTELELTAIRLALAKLDEIPADAYLSVNVSPATAVTPELYDLFAAEPRAAHRVVLELTEHTRVAHYPALHTALAALRRLGLRVAVDDAGSGFASLGHILKLGPDIVKIDIELVRDIHIDPARRALCAGLLIFANQIGARLVAEGVETEHELAALLDIGVTHGQGYYLGRPTSSPLPATVPVCSVPAI